VPNARSRRSSSAASRSPTVCPASVAAGTSGSAAASSASARRAGDWPSPRSQMPSTSASCRAGTGTSVRGFGEAWLRRLQDAVVPLPALVLELEVLDRDGVGVRVEVGDRLELRHPAAVDQVGDRRLAGLVEDLDDHVLAEVLQRHLRPQARAEVPDLVGPLLEFGVVGDPALERDRLELGAPGLLAAGAPVAPVAVLCGLG